MAYRFYTLDVFTPQRFGGNPLAVVLGGDDLESGQMQAVAREFNLSETVFVLKPQDGANTARVRIFTPAREMPFAGHPTVGTAVLLSELAAEKGAPADGVIRLEEGVGVVPVTVKAGGAGPSYGELSGAVMPVHIGDEPGVGAVAAALSLDESDIGFGNHQVARFDAGNTFLFAPIASREALGRAAINSACWPGLEGRDGVGVYLYCAGTRPGIDFHARLFGPEAGVIEDPATGSAAATFPGPLLNADPSGDGVHKWTIAQGEDMGRPSVISLEADVLGGAISAVRVGGQAVRVSSGEIDI